MPPEEVLEALVQAPDVVVERFEQVETSLDEIFIRVVGRSVEEESALENEREERIDEGVAA